MANRGNTWKVPAGQTETYLVTIKDGTGTAITSVYAGTEVLTSKLWEGGSLAPITGVVVATWHTAAAGTVDVVVAPLSTMEPGFYRVRLSVTYAGATAPYYEGWLQVEAIPGVATEDPVYCTLQDCIDKAGDWLKQLMQGGASGQTNFNVERAEAREWLDDIIVAASRPYSYTFDLNYATIIGSLPFGPIESPDSVIAGYLADDMLIVRPRTVECCAYKSLGFICERRMSFDEAGDDYRQRASWYHRRASNSLRRYRAEIDLNADGIADVAFNLGVASFR